MPKDNIALVVLLETREETSTLWPSLVHFWTTFVQFDQLWPTLALL